MASMLYYRKKQGPWKGRYVERYVMWFSRKRLRAYREGIGMESKEFLQWNCSMKNRKVISIDDVKNEKCPFQFQFWDVAKEEVITEWACKSREIRDAWVNRIRHDLSAENKL